MNIRELNPKDSEGPTWTLFAKVAIPGSIGLFLGYWALLWIWNKSKPKVKQTVSGLKYSFTKRPNTDIELQLLD
jgi:hypothetical protein